MAEQIDRMESSSEKIRERFSRISLSKSLLALIGFGILAGVGLYQIEQIFSPDQTNFELILIYALYAIPLILFVWVLKREGLPLLPIFIGDKKNLPKTAYVFLLFTITVTTLWVTIVLLYTVEPGWAESYVAWLNSIEMFNIGEETTAIQYLLIFGSVAVVAPIAEEVVFRGILIERLGRKSGYKTALIVSSIFFGILHVSFISATLFGLFLGILYLKTRSLMLPVLIHIANNAIATFMIFTEDYLEFTTWDSAAPYIEYAWMGLTLFVAVMAWLIWFLIQNWHSVTNMTPFRKAEAADSDEIPEESA